MPAFWLCSLNFLFGHCLSEGLSMLRHPLSSDQNGTVRGQLVDPAYLLNKNNIVCFFVWRERSKYFCLCCTCFYDVEVLQLIL